MAMEPQQGSPMSKMDGTRLPSTPWPFWNTTSCRVKMMMKNIASKSNLALSIQLIYFLGAKRIFLILSTYSMDLHIQQELDQFISQWQ